MFFVILGSTKPTDCGVPKLQACHRRWWRHWYFSFYFFFLGWKFWIYFFRCFYQIVELGLLICMVEAMFVSKDNNFRTDLQEKSYTVDVYTLCMCKSILVLVVTVLIDLCFFFFFFEWWQEKQLLWRDTWPESSRRNMNIRVSNDALVLVRVPIQFT